MIADWSVDAVLIASLDQIHAPLTTACIEAGKPAPREQPPSRELVGECGSVFPRSPARGEILADLKSTTALPTDWPTDWRPRSAEAYRPRNSAWVKSIETGPSFGASARDGHVATGVAEAGVESFAKGATVNFSLADKLECYRGNRRHRRRLGMGAETAAKRA